MNIKKNLFIFVLSLFLLCETYAIDYFREGTALAGAITGAEIGAEVGVILGGPPGATLGTLIGGVAGGLGAGYGYDKLNNNKKYIYPIMFE